LKLGDKTQGTVGWYPPLYHKSEYNSVFFDFRLSTLTLAR
jgi:hypothetical protein